MFAILVHLATPHTHSALLTWSVSISREATLYLYLKESLIYGLVDYYEHKCIVSLYPCIMMADTKILLFAYLPTTKPVNQFVCIHPVSLYKTFPNLYDGLS